MAAGASVHVLTGFATVAKQAAQGAALLADGLAGGESAALVDALGIREASGTVLDHLYVISPAAARARLGIQIVRVPRFAGVLSVQKVLIAGVSTRAAAESAARAGFAVTAIDAFGDLDQHPSVRASRWRASSRRARPRRAARASSAMRSSISSSFENHPSAIASARRGARAVGEPRRRSSAACAIRILLAEALGSAVHLRPRVRLTPDTTADAHGTRPTRIASAGLVTDGLRLRTQVRRSRTRRDGS